MVQGLQTLRLFCFQTENIKSYAGRCLICPYGSYDTEKMADSILKILLVRTLH